MAVAAKRNNSTFGCLLPTLIITLLALLLVSR